MDKEAEEWFNALPEWFNALPFRDVENTDQFDIRVSERGEPQSILTKNVIDVFYKAQQRAVIEAEIEAIKPPIDVLKRINLPAAQGHASYLMELIKTKEEQLKQLKGGK